MGAGEFIKNPLFEIIAFSPAKYIPFPALFQAQDDKKHQKKACCKTVDVVCRRLTRRHAAIGRSAPRTHGKAVCRIHSGKPSGNVPRSISGVERSHPAFEDDFELCSKSLKAAYAAALIKNRQVTCTGYCCRPGKGFQGDNAMPPWDVQGLSYRIS